MEEIQRALHVLRNSPLSSPLLFLLFSILLFFSYAFLKTQHRRNTHLPPSPRKLPFIGHLHLLSSLPHYPLRDLSKKFGPTMLLYFGQKPTLIVSSAEAAQEVLKNQDLNFCSRSFSPAGSVYSYGSRNVSFAPYGEHWRQARKFLVVNLLSVSRVQSLRKIMEEEVWLLVEKISDSCSSGSLNMSEILYGFTSGVIGRIIAGNCVEREERTRRFREIFKEAVALITEPSLEDIFPQFGWMIRACGGSSRLKKLVEVRDELLEEILVEHERKKREDREEEVDFVDLLLRSSDMDGDYAFSRDDVKSISMDIISGGTDTVYVVLEWALSELIKNPTLLRKIQEELRHVNGREDDCVKAPLLHALLKEVLRLHMPAPLLPPREAISDTQLNGYDVPAGTQVFINAWAIARDEKWWDSPEKFSPERFLSTSFDPRGKDMQFLPFGAGRRMCPGYVFALCELELALAGLLKNFDWEMPPGKTPEDLDMEESPGITIHRKTPLRLVAIPRA